MVLAPAASQANAGDTNVVNVRRARLVLISTLQSMPYRLRKHNTGTWSDGDGSSSAKIQTETLLIATAPADLGAVKGAGEAPQRGSASHCSD